MKEHAEINMLQPMTGLQPEAVEEAFKGLKVSVSKEFKEAVIEKARIL
jgi:hypothetical protein